MVLNHALICNPKLVQVGLDLIDFPSIAYESIPSSTPDFRQSAKRAHRPGQTQACDTTIFVYPTMEHRLLKLMTVKMKISLMVEGSLPGEGLVTYGNEDDEDGSVMLQLARSIVQDMEQGARRTTMEETGAELQALYEEIAALVPHQQQYVGEERPTPSPEIEPITVTTLEPLPVRSAGGTWEEKETVPGRVQKEARSVTVITVPASQVLDPWAPYRARVQELQASQKKKRRSRSTNNEHHSLSLWTQDGQEVAPPARGLRRERLPAMEQGC